MRLVTLLILILLLLASLPRNTGIGQDNTEQDNGEQVIPQADIRKWNREIRTAHHLMDSPRYRDRLRGVRMLEALPDKAEPFILQKLNNISYRAKIHTFKALLNRKSLAVASLIVKEAEIAENVYQRGQLVRLLQHSINGWEILEKAYEEDQSTGNSNPHLKAFYVEFIDRDVHDHLIYCMQTYKGGYFRAMFDKCWRYGYEGLMVMIEIAKGEAIRFPYYDLEDGRALAAEALIDWPFEVETKKELLVNLSHELTLQAISKWLGMRGRQGSLNRVQYALHRMGVEQSNINLQIMRHQTNIKTYVKNLNYSSTIYECKDLTDIYLALRDDTNAISYMHEAIKAYEVEKPENRQFTISLIWYNLACLRSLRGNTTGAVSALKQTIAHGYHDFYWMWLDRDLEATWNSEAFKQWVQELRKSEEWKHQLPDRQPGTLPE